LLDARFQREFLKRGARRSNASFALDPETMVGVSYSAGRKPAHARAEITKEDASPLFAQ
jgi:hypothetical protein